MIIETGFEQGSKQWISERLKSIGGTGISKIITPTGAASKSRDDYLYEKAHSIISGKPSKPAFKTFEMQWGHDHEPDARMTFAFIKEVDVQQCAMIWADDKKQSHVSPDGFFEMRAGLEIKCPQLKQFIEIKNSKTVLAEYILQIQKSLALTGWDIWYFMGYFPNLQPVIIPVERDENLIRTIKIEEQLFIEDLDKLVSNLKGE